MPLITLIARDPRPSCHYTREEAERWGAIDVSISIEVASVAHDTNGVTLCADRVNGGHGACGAPRDGWVDSRLLSIVEGATVDPYDRMGLFTEIEILAARCIHTGAVAISQIAVA